MTLYDVILGILRRPYNFGVFHCRRPKFGNMIYFDVFSFKMSLVFKFKASMTSSIWVVYKGLVTLMFLNV